MLPDRSLRSRRWRPPAHWRLLAFCLTVLIAVVLFQGFATHAVGGTDEGAPAGAAGADLPLGRSLLSASGGRLVSSQPPVGRRIALTFDDGPDPRWTPAIASVLRAARAPATFFVIGSQAARHPGIVRDLSRQGFEIGNHTFTHDALGNGHARMDELQIELAQAVIAGTTGHYARLLRPPYSAAPDAVTKAQEHRLAALIGGHYLLALADLDSQDWQRPGVAAIVRNATPRGPRGGVILFHDGGGDRRQTVAALRVLIPRLRAAGFRIVSLAELAGTTPSVLAPLASPGDRRRGQVFQASIRLAFGLVALLAGAVFLVSLIVAARVVLLLGFAAYHVRTTRRDDDTGADRSVTVTVIVPAYNEAVGIARAVRSLLAADYPELEVIVVDDGSTDATADIVAAIEDPRLRVIRQDNAGKAAALNTGIEFSTADVIVMVDGDTVFEPDTIRRLIAPLADPRVGAVSGNTKVGNRHGLLGRWQHIEYVSGFNLDRRLYEVLQCTPTVPGAIGAFRRDVVLEVGGVSADTLAEDTDLTLAIGRSGRRVVYAESARAWTEAPSTLGGLWRQRYRWSFGTMQAVWKHRGAMLSRDPRERRIGRRALPYMLVFQILLPILAPLIDLFAIYGLLFLDPRRVTVVWVLFNGIQLALAAFAFKLDRESLRPLWTLPLQQFLYRQLMYLVIIESTISALLGLRAHWQTIPRTGDVEVQTV